MAPSSGLTAEPAAVGGNQDVELAGGFGHQQRLLNSHAMHLGRKVLLHVTAVDENLAAAGPQKYTGDGQFAPSCT